VIQANNVPPGEYLVEVGPTALGPWTQVEPHYLVAQVPQRDAVTFAASITPDLALGALKTITLTGAITVNAPLNGAAGQELTFVWAQDGTGGRIITYNAVYLIPAYAGNSQPSLPNSVLVDKFVCLNGVNWQLVNRNQNYPTAQAPAFAASFTPDLSLGTIIRLGAMTANLTVNTPTNPGPAGQEVTFVLLQDGTGTRTITYAGNWKGTGVAATVTTAGTLTVDRFVNVDGTLFRIYSRATGQTA
jgi:hypothetical protein